MNKLFEDFKNPDYDSWINQLKKDLKDKPLESLTTQPERELSMNAYYHPTANVVDTKSFQKNKLNNEWFIREVYVKPDKKNLLDDLNQGVNSIGLFFNTEEEFLKTTSEILFEHIQSDIYFEKTPPITEVIPEQTHLNYDVINRLVVKGLDQNVLENYVSFYKSYHGNKKLWITAKTYGNAGASNVNELAFCLAHLYEYIHALTEQNISLDDINENLIVEISLTNNYFLNIAKVRALRTLVDNLFYNIDKNYQPKSILIYGETSQVFNAVNDANNNYLRQTTQAMSGIIGGCDTITIDYLKSTNENQNQQNKRIARNIQLLLKEEAYFDKVVDAATGSMAIENMTNQLIENAWKKFCLIEDKGGFIACFKSGYLHDEIKKDIDFLLASIEQNKFNFVGVSKYQNKAEEFKLPKKSEEQTKSTYQLIKPFSLEMEVVQQLQKMN